MRVKSLASHLFLHIGGTQGPTTVAHVSKLFFISYDHLVFLINLTQDPDLYCELLNIFLHSSIHPKSTSGLIHFTSCILFVIYPTELCLIDTIVGHPNTAGGSRPSNKRVSPHKCLHFLLSDKQSFKNDRCLITLAHIQKSTLQGCESVAIYSHYPAIRINMSLSLT